MRPALKPAEDGHAQKAWLPLRMERFLANETEDIDANILATLASTYMPFNDLLNAHSGTVSIVGSGHSLKRTWRGLKGDVIACNSAGQFLLSKGVVPKYWMAFDADPMLAPCITPHQGITYLLASRVPRCVFEKLRGCKVIVWHAKGDVHLDDLLEKEMARRHALTGQWTLEPMIAGGSTSVTRCMFMVHAMGYRTQHLFGVDSSFPDGSKPHIAEGADEHQQKYLEIRTGPGNPHQFKTTTWLAGQAEDFMVLATSLRRLGVRIVVHGSGLIPHLAKEIGLDVDDQSKVKQIARSISSKAVLLWNQI